MKIMIPFPIVALVVVAVSLFLSTHHYRGNFRRFVGQHGLWVLRSFPSSSCNAYGVSWRLVFRLFEQDEFDCLVTPSVSLLVNGLDENVDEVSRVQHIEEMRVKAAHRKESIRAGMRHVWSGYKSYAWGKDELRPLSVIGDDDWGGIGLLLVESMSTLLLLGMNEEFDEAAFWVENNLNFSSAEHLPLFETTIRELGGLVSAYDLTGNSVFLQKATELGRLFLPAFETNTGIPTGEVNINDMRPSDISIDGTALLAELGSLQLEFRYLSHHTGDPIFGEKAMKPLFLMGDQKPKYGLYPLKVNITDGTFASSKISFGASGDSFYEYLLKVWIQGGKKETWLREMYDRAINGMVEILLQASSPSGLVYVAEFDLDSGSLVRAMDHLTCFLPATLALGAHTDPMGPDSLRSKRDISIAKALMHTCHEMYVRSESGLAPENVKFKKGADMVSTTESYYMLRPEAAESLYILHELTGDAIYREWSWEIWEAIERHCKTSIAYGTLREVNNPVSGVDDQMESFFVAETIKYLYLIQETDFKIDLDRYVFNTEAHPLSIFL